MAASVSMLAARPCASLSLPSDCVSAPVRAADFASFSGLKAVQPVAAVAQSVAHRPSPSGRSAVVVRAGVAVPPSISSLAPVGDRVLVRLEQVEERTAGGLLLPSSSQSKPQGGKVVAVGDGRTIGDKTVPVGLEAGARVVYSKYAGTEVDYEGAPHVLLREDDVVGTLDGDDVAQLKPLADRVLIKVQEAEQVTAGGVLLTESAKEKPVIGTVVAVGPGAVKEDGSRRAVEVAVGSTVLYSKYAASEFKAKDGSPHVVLREADVMAVLS
ncbi:unnamed protein product [Closterium sp. NIES-64]|nr:unnamed protein product [Closterium sp. NIES-64]